MAQRAEELRPEDLQITEAGVLRWLFMREAIARGLDNVEAKTAVDRKTDKKPPP